MATYMVFINSKAAFTSTDKRKAGKAFRKTPTHSTWGGKVIYQTVTLWRDSTTIDVK